MSSRATTVGCIGLAALLLLTVTSEGWSGSEPPGSFRTSCGETALPPGILDVICIAACGDGMARVACRYPEKRGSFYPDPIDQMDHVSFMLRGEVPLEALLRHLEAHVGWPVERSEDLDAVVEEGTWRLPVDGERLAEFRLRPFGTANLTLEPADRQWHLEIILSMHRVRQLAKKKNAIALHYLGVIHAQGRGVPQDDEKAFEYLQKAAKAGHAEAQAQLAYLYYMGRGVKQSDAKAVRWYRVAARQGVPYAKENLCVMYREGRYRSASPYEEIGCLRREAEQGSAESQYRLGEIYFKGSGNYIEAFVWLTLAAEKGHRDARTKLQILTARLRPDELKKARRRLEAARRDVKSDSP